MEVGVGIFAICWIVGALLSLAGLAVWIWMLIDCLANEPNEGNEKIIWILVILFANWIGALIYYFVRRPQRIREIGR